ncbi:MAG TPA: hypothetical protein VFJ06_14965 [Halococcus sp.]|nr:hypothetical protein [Halococcus sp.]
MIQLISATRRYRFDFVIVGIDANHLVRNAREAKETYEDAIDRRNQE